MFNRFLTAVLLAVSVIAPAGAFDLRRSITPGALPPLTGPDRLRDGELSINAADRRFFYLKPDRTLGVSSALDAVPAGRRLVETGAADDATIGGVPLPSVLGAKAPVANPTFTGAVTAPSVKITGTGSAGEIPLMTVGGRTLADRAAEVTGLAVAAIPGLSTSTATVTCTVFQAGSGFVLCPAGAYDFAVGHGVLVPGQGAAYPGYSAATGLGGTVLRTGGSTTRCYVLVGLDGLQGYGSPSAQGCVANAPAVPSANGFVKVSWTNGSNPPPTYAIYQGPSGGPYALVDFLDNTGAGATQFGYDYGRPAPAAEFWLPSTIAAGQAPARQAGHGVVSAVRTDNYIDVGFGLAGPANSSVTLYHDNALPIRFALANADQGASFRLPLGIYPLYATNFGGTTITMNSKKLIGTDRDASILKLMNGMVASPLFNLSNQRSEVNNFTIDTGGFSSSAAGILQFGVANAPAARDLKLLNVSKNAVGSTDVQDLLVERVYATSTPDFGNQSTFIHSVRGTNTKIINSLIDGFSLNMNDNRCTISGNVIRNFYSAGVATEVDPTGNGKSCEIAYNIFEPSPVTTSDINDTFTHCVESWQPGDNVHDNTCINSIASAYSMGGQRSRLVNNTTSRTPNIVNGSPAFALRFDSAINFAAGAIVTGNTILSGYTIGLGASGASSGRKCDGCIIGANALGVATTPIDFSALSGAEIFTAPTPIQFSLLPTYHAATTVGRRLFCTDCLKPGQSTGSGTGIEVVDDGSAWVRSDGSVATR